MSTRTDPSRTHAVGPTAATGAQASLIVPVDTFVLADGTRVQLRPLGSGDRDGLAALFTRLSPESRYRRFLSPKPALTRRELVYLTDIDRVHHEAVAAVDSRDGSIVGVGRYVRFRDRPSVAEVGFEVADELQGMGIGTALATHIVQHARASGLALLTAATLWDNRSARAILRGLGFRARASEGSVIELDLELDSPSAAERHRAASGSEFDAPETNDGRRRTRGAGSDAFQLLTRKEPHERRC
jgi:RimJ/RimL family protein N-acetyltransferase